MGVPRVFRWHAHFCLHELAILLGVRVAADVNPTLILAARDGCLRCELQAVGIDGFLDGVGRGVDGDLDLLIPQLGLPRGNLVVQLSRLVAQFQMLLAKFKNEDANCSRAN